MSKPKPIAIDLNNITDAMIEEALPNMGCREYAGPCIIGTLIPKRSRERLDGSLDGNPNIGDLIDKGLITMPAEQVELAGRLQRSFDKDQRYNFRSTWVSVRRELKALAA